MATVERTGPLKLERQLDGSATEAFDCGVAACVMAIDDASCGLIRPSTEAESRRVPAYDPLADGRFEGCPNGRRLWPFWLVRAATGNVRDAKGRRLYPAEDRWIGLVVSKARPIGEPDDGVDPGDPDSPDVTELLKVIADTTGELEDHIAGLTTAWMRSGRICTRPQSASASASMRSLKLSRSF